MKTIPEIQAEKKIVEKQMFDLLEDFLIKNEIPYCEIGISVTQTEFQKGGCKPSIHIVTSLNIEIKI